MIKNMYIGLHVKYPSFLTILINFLGTFSENTQNFMKICPVGGELPHADGQTDRRDEADSHFSRFRTPSWQYSIF